MADEVECFWVADAAGSAPAALREPPGSQLISEQSRHGQPCTLPSLQPAWQMELQMTCIDHLSAMSPASTYVTS